MSRRRLDMDNQENRNEKRKMSASREQDQQKKVASVPKKEASTAGKSSTKRSTLEIPSTSRAERSVATQTKDENLPENNSYMRLTISSRSSQYPHSLTDLDQNLEHNAVASKFDKFLKRLEAYRKMEMDQPSTSRKLPELTLDEAAALDDLSLHSFYRLASRIVEICTERENTNVDIEYCLAERKFSKRYPHYWKSLLKQYETEVSDKTFADEIAQKNVIIQSCKRLLEEEDRYAERLVGDIGKKRGIKFDDDAVSISENFNAACEFMGREYPLLLVHLIEKMDILRLCILRQIVSHNKEIILEAFQQPAEILEDLEQDIKKKTE